MAEIASIATEATERELVVTRILDAPRALVETQAGVANLQGDLVREIFGL